MYVYTLFRILLKGALAGAATLLVMGCSVNPEIQGFLSGGSQLDVQLTNLSLDEGSSGDIVITLPAALPTEYVLNYTAQNDSAVAGADFTLTSGSITFAAGATTATLNLAADQDSVFELNESFKIVFSDAANRTAQATVTITEDDTPPTVQFAAASSSVAENAGAATTMQIEMSEVASVAVTVPVTVSGGTAAANSDFTYTASVSIAAGTTVGVFSVTPINDVATEGTETANFTLGTPSIGSVGATPTHVLTITDDETPSITFAAASSTTTENAGTYNLPVQLTSAIGSAVTVQYTVTGGTATNGVEYTLSGSSLTIPALATSANLVFTLSDDAVIEPSKYVQVTLSSPTGALLGATTVHTVRIKDSDVLPGTWTGDGGDNLWSNTLNWSNEVVPNLAPTYFNAGCSGTNCNVTVDASVNVDSIDMTATYTGTISLGAHSIMIDESLVMAGGTFDASDSGGYIFLDGLNQTGGTSKFGCPVDWILTGVDFTQTGGTMQWSAGGKLIAEIFVDRNLQLSNSNAIPVFEYDASSTGAAVVTGNLLVEDFIYKMGGTGTQIKGGTVKISGDLDAYTWPSVFGGTSSGGTSIFEFNGTGDQTIMGYAGMSLPAVVINKPSGNLNLTGTVDFANNLTLTAGTIVPGTSTVRFMNSANRTVTCSQPLALNNLELRPSSGADLTLACGSNLTVAGLLTFDEVANGSQLLGDNIFAQGSVAATDWSGGTATLNVTGTGTQTLTGATGGSLSHLVINKTGGDVTLVGNVELAGNLNGVAGTVVPGTSTVTFVGATAAQILSDFTFYNLENKKDTTSLDLASYTLTVLNDFSHLSATSPSFTSTTGKLVVYRHANYTGGASGVYPPLEMTGSEPATLSGGVANIKYLRINKSSGVQVTSALGVLVVDTEFSVVSGLADFQTTTLNLIYGNNTTIDIGSTSISDLVVMRFASADVNIVGTLTVLNGVTVNQGPSATTAKINGGVLAVGGSMSHLPDGSIAGTAEILFNGSGDQTVFSTHASGGLISSGKVTIDKPSGKVILGSNINFNGAGQDLEILNGRLDMGGYNLTINDALNMSAGTHLYKNCQTLTYNAGSSTIAGSIHNGKLVTLNVADAASPVLEGATQDFVITTTPQNCVDTPFEYATVNGTAAAPGDFTAIGATLATIPSTGTSLTVTVTTLDDTLDEVNENYTVSLFNLGEGAVAGDIVGQGIITDDDDANAPTISIADATEYEADPLGMVVTLSAATGQAVTFDYATVSGTAGAPADYVAVTATATIPIGETSITLPNIVTNGDGIDGDENFTVQLSNVVGVQAAGNDLQATVTLLESGIGLSNLVVNNVTHNSFDVSVNFTEDDNNNAVVTVYYCNANGFACNPLTGASQVMARGAGVYTTSVTGLEFPYFPGDTLTVQVVASDSGGATGSPLSTNIQLVPYLDVLETARTEGQSLVFIAKLTRAYTQNVVFNYATSDDTATNGGGNDYTAVSGVATITTGQTTVTVATVVTNDDGGAESAEKFNFTISAASGALIRTATVPGYIVDNDPGPTWNRGVAGNVNEIVVQPDGKKILGGDFKVWDDTLNPFFVSINSDGTEDLTFNMDSGFDGWLHQPIRAADGKIIIAGGFKTYKGQNAGGIIRLNSDMTRDTNFDPGTGFDSSVGSVAVQPDGKVLVGGSFTAYKGDPVPKLVRLNTDGSLDTTFNVGLGPTMASYVLIDTILVRPSGEIVVFGRFTHFDGAEVNHVVQLKANGQRDVNFNTGSGFSSVPAIYFVENASLQSDGKIVAVGGFATYQGVSQNRITRINTDGSLDTTFNVGTGFTGWRVDAVLVQPDGKVLVGGWFSSYNSQMEFGITRLNTNGTLDGGFANGDGMWGSFGAQAFALQPDGKILVGGAFYDYNGSTVNNLIRLNSNGTLDGSFSVGSGPNSSVTGLFLFGDGRILATGGFTSYRGSAQNYIVRVNTDGSRDSTFSVGTGFQNNVYSLALQTDGKVIVGGAFTSYNGSASNRIARLNTNGSLDGTFAIGSGSDNQIKVVRIFPDGKIYAGGAMSNFNGSPRGKFFRLNSDGSLDGSYFSGAGFTGSPAEIDALAYQPDGKVIAVGEFTNLAGFAIKNIARLNTDGSRDTAFNIGTGPNWPLDGVGVQSNGKIVIAGGFTTFNGISAVNVARLLQDGTLDTGFYSGSGASSIEGLLVLPNDQIVIAGWFTTFDSISRKLIALLNEDGTLDASFNPAPSYASGYIKGLFLQGDNTIHAAGSFTHFNNAIAMNYNSFAPPNSVSIGALVTSGVSQTGFTATVGFYGDYDNDATFTLKWCNQTDNAGCTPANDVPMIWVSSTSTYAVEISGLTAPQDPGDTLKLEIIVTDPDGVTGSPLAGTVTLAP